MNLKFHKHFLPFLPVLHNCDVAQTDMGQDFLLPGRMPVLAQDVQVSSPKRQDYCKMEHGYCLLTGTTLSTALPNYSPQHPENQQNIFSD
jgi:hypothetical protein